MILRMMNRNRGYWLGLVFLLCGLVATSVWFYKLQLWRGSPVVQPSAANTQPTTAATQVADDADEPSPQDAAVTKNLDHHLPELRFNANRLSEVIDFLRDVTGTKIDVDWDALAKAGISRDAPVTARLHDIKFSKVLDLIFKSVETADVKLGYRIINGVLMVSTRPALSKFDMTSNYDIADLLFLSPGATPSEADRANRLDELKKYITDNVDTNSWKDNGGYVGTISEGSAKNVLVISQTPENQRAIRLLLAKLRESRKQDPQGFPEVPALAP